MNWKLIGLLIFITLIIITSIIVWNNRASDKLVSNFVSVIFLGLTSLLITSIISLKEEIKRNKFAAVMLLQNEPLTIVEYNSELNTEGVPPFLLMTSNAVQILQKNDTSYTSIISMSEKEYVKLINDLFQRYIVDLLVTRYKTHWYIESVEIKTPNIFMDTSRIIDENLPVSKLDWNTITQIFHENPFIEIGYFTDIKTGKKYTADIMIPNGIKLAKQSTSRGFNLIFENKFIALEIKCEHFTSDNYSNEKINKAFNLSESDKNKFRFQPYIIDYKLTKKKFRSGHPDMDKYDYWAEDLISFLRKNISVSEFWRIIELNN
jgi:hypothetical protein